MARIVKIFISLLIVLSGIYFPVYSEGEQSLSTLITVQNIPYESCYRVFNTDNVSLFFLTLAAINANRFNVNEIQSKSGYILFTAVNKPFIATVVNVNTNQGMLKITPADNNYYFQPGIILNIYKYIDMNLNKKTEVIF